MEADIAKMLSPSPVFTFSLMLVLISYASQSANAGQDYYCIDNSSFNNWLKIVPEEWKYNDTVSFILTSKEVSNILNDATNVKVKSIKIRFRAFLLIPKSTLTTQLLKILTTQLLKIPKRIIHPVSSLPLTNLLSIRLSVLLSWALL